MNHYDILGIERNADITEIDRAYLKLCRQYKEDGLRTPDDFSFERIHSAYENLSNSDSRRLYDASLSQTNNPPGNSIAAVETPTGDEWDAKDYSGITEWVSDANISTRATFSATGNYRAPVAVPKPRWGAIVLTLLALTGIPVGVAFWTACGMSYSNATSLSLLAACVFSVACFRASPRNSGSAAKNYDGYRQNPRRQVFHDLTPYERNRLMDSAFALKCKIWGMPGILDDAVEKFGQRNIALGTAGEERTAQMLDSLLKIPGTRIFHGLKFPGSNTADVDHAIINGDKIVFIDSKMWAGGHYKWLRKDTIWRTRGKDAKELHTNFPAAVDYLSERFRRQQVRAITVIHSNDRYPVSVDNGTAFSVKLASGPDAIREIGNWFAKDLTGKIDLDAMQKLEYQLK